MSLRAALGEAFLLWSDRFREQTEPFTVLYPLIRRISGTGKLFDTITDLAVLTFTSFSTIYRSNALINLIKESFTEDFKKLEPVRDVQFIQSKDCHICQDSLEKKFVKRIVVAHEPSEKITHAFHRQCILPWIEHKKALGDVPNCPVCFIRIQLVFPPLGEKVGAVVKGLSRTYFWGGFDVAGLGAFAMLLTDIKDYPDLPNCRAGMMMSYAMACWNRSLLISGMLFTVRKTIPIVRTGYGKIRSCFG